MCIFFVFLAYLDQRPMCILCHHATSVWHTGCIICHKSFSSWCRRDFVNQLIYGRSNLVRCLKLKSSRTNGCLPLIIRCWKCQSDGHRSSAMPSVASDGISADCGPNQVCDALASEFTVRFWPNLVGYFHTTWYSDEVKHEPHYSITSRVMALWFLCSQKFAGEYIVSTLSVRPFILKLLVWAVIPKLLQIISFIVAHIYIISRRCVKDSII